MHCSAGRGRTGTLIATFLIAEHLLNISETLWPGSSVRESGFTDPRIEPDRYYTEVGTSSNASSSSDATTADKLEFKKSPYGSWARISIFAMVRRLREQRWGMVSNDPQYSYCYQFLRQWVQYGETARLREMLEKRYSAPNI